MNILFGLSSGLICFLSLFRYGKAVNRHSLISSGILIGLILVNYNFFHESIGWDYGNGSLYFLLGLVIFSGSKYVELIQGKIHERLGNWGYSIGFVMILGLLYKGNQTLGMSNFSLGTIAWVIILVLICYKEMV